MSKIIKIDANNSDLGNIFAQIDSASSNEVHVVYDTEINDLFSTSDINLIEDYAKTQDKVIKFMSSEKVQRAGFVIGSDVNETPINISSTVAKPKLTVPKVGFKMPKLKFSPILLVVILVLALIGAFAFYFFNKSYPKAQVVLNIRSQVYTGTQETSILANIDTADVQTDSIPGKLVSAESSQELIVIPTGEKEIGEKAVGKLNLYNKTNSEKTVKKGTEITINTEGDKSFIFYTTEEVKVDKKTEGEAVTDNNGDIKKADVYGTAKVNIEAELIGSNYNIEKDKLKSIKVGEYNRDTEISADIETEPNGGSSKKATVVLQKDLDDLKEKLTEKATEKAQSSIKESVEEGYEILSNSLDTKTTSLTYDKKADEEADKIIGNITIEVTTLAYKSEDLKLVLADKIKELVPGNFSVVSGAENLVVTSSSKELIFNETSGVIEKILVSNKVQSSVAPKINPEDIKESISGKQIQDAQKYLGEISNIVGAKIVISPNIPIFNKRLPNKNKISVEINISDGAQGQ